MTTDRPLTEIPVPRTVPPVRGSSGPGERVRRLQRRRRLLREEMLAVLVLLLLLGLTVAVLAVEWLESGQNGSAASARVPGGGAYVAAAPRALAPNAAAHSTLVLLGGAT